MKRTIRLAAAFIVLSHLTFAARSGKQWMATGSAQPAPVKVTLLSSDVKTTVLKVETPGFFRRSVMTPNGAAFIIRADESSPILEKGAPDLPKVTVPLVIPDRSAMTVQVIASSYVDIAGIDIAPSKGTLTRDIDPSSVPYTYGPAFGTDAFYPETGARLREPYILRDLRGQTAVLFPFRYNPVTRVLRVYTSLTVNVSETAGDVVNGINRTAFPKRIDREYRAIYANHFKNLPPQVLYTPVDETGSMLIIAYGSYMPAMAPYVEWKNRKGLYTEMVDVATLGGTSAAIKAFIANYYANNGLKYVLLVGDHAQVPTFFINGNEASDPNYGFLSGNDSYAEVIVGRFSAESVADVTTQVQRVLDYERYPQPAQTWYTAGVGVASDQGPGDDGEMDYEHVRNIRTKLMAFTYTDVAELYDGTQGGLDAPGDPTPAMLSAEFNAGATIMNYTGHGSKTTCGTSGFGVNDVAQLTNYDMLPFIWSVACVNGDFTSGSPCIAEALLRAQSGGQPTGGLATMMSSINQYWDEPMEGQDEFNDILVETYQNNIKRTFGGISVNGCMKMNDTYGNTGYDMTDTWLCFGDPTIYVRTATPLPMTVTHITQSPTGIHELLVNCNQDDALVALTVAGNIIGTGVVAGGSSLVSFATLINPCTIDVTVTGFNRIPYEGQVVVTNNPTGLPETGAGPVTLWTDESSSTLHVSSGAGAIGRITVFNAAGQQVLQPVVTGLQASLAVSLGRLPAGAYVADVQAGQATVRKRFMVR